MTEIERLSRKIDLLTRTVERLAETMESTRDTETIPATEAARRLGIKPATLRKAYTFLPRVKKGKSYVYLLSGIQKYLTGEITDKG